MKITLLFLGALWFFPCHARPVAGKFENRCGWYTNPSPSNVWLRDKDGEWEISEQGGHEAKGDGPRFKIEDESTFVQTSGGSYGYGCVCLKVKTDAAQKRILEIKSSTVKKLAVCRADKSLKEPDNPLQ